MWPGLNKRCRPGSGLRGRLGVFGSWCGLESPRLALGRHRHREYRLESPRLARLPEDVPARHFVPARSSAPRRRLPEGPKVPRWLRLPLSPSLRSRERPGPFHSHPAGWPDQRTYRLARPAHLPAGRTSAPTGWTGSRSSAAGRAVDPRTRDQPHTSPADSLTRACGARPLIPRTIWLATASGPSLRSDRAGGTRASARHPHVEGEVVDLEHTSSGDPIL